MPSGCHEVHEDLDRISCNNLQNLKEVTLYHSSSEADILLMQRKPVIGKKLLRPLYETVSYM